VSKYELIDSKSEEYFDTFIQTGFANPLDVSQIIEIIELIAEVTTTDMAKQICEGISFLQITETEITIQLRYTTMESPKFKPNVSSRAKAQFMFYLLAKIDFLCPLREVPLPEGWREWLNFPEHIAEYGYENG
jgi:hypothetical protein